MYVKVHHGAITEKEKELLKTAVFWQFLLSTRESQKTSMVKLVSNIISGQFIQTNLFKSLNSCSFLGVKDIFQLIACFCHVK